MINIFRKYRRKLSNKSIDGKYFKYAIGEIALVVVGILIALTINNWNEGRKQRLNDQLFLQNLKEELNNDLNQLYERKTEYEGINDGIKKTINILNSTQQTSSGQQKTISGTIRSFEVLTPLGISDAANNSTQASLALGRIDNELNKKFIRHLKNVSSHKAIIDKLGFSLQQLFSDWVIQHVELDYLDSKNESVSFDVNLLRKEIGLKNTLHKSHLFRFTYISYMNSEIKDIQELLKLISGKLGE